MELGMYGSAVTGSPRHISAATLGKCGSDALSSHPPTHPPTYAETNADLQSFLSWLPHHAGSSGAVIQH